MCAHSSSYRYIYRTANITILSITVVIILVTMIMLILPFVLLLLEGKFNEKSIIIHKVSLQRLRQTDRQVSSPVFSFPPIPTPKEATIMLDTTANPLNHFTKKVVILKQRERRRDSLNLAT